MLLELAEGLAAVGSLQIYSQNKRRNARESFQPNNPENPPPSAEAL